MAIINQLEKSQLDEAVRRIYGSSSFSRSDRSKQLLRFLAQSAIEGSVPAGKEITAALWHGRGMSDDNVRQEIRRLRRKLEVYYQTEGKDDPSRISIPMGSYALAVVGHAVSDPGTHGTF